ncbi:MAG: Nif3-like dinuclear metal center hexameric protein, partial [Candidatus Kapaibacteriota bacterium]
GTSWLFAENLGLGNLNFLITNEKLPGFGFGVVGEFDDYLDTNTFLEKVQSVTFSPLRWCLGKDEKIKKVSLVAGSGINFVESALENGSDAFISADIKYHIFHKYNRKIMLVDPGHWEMEYFVPLGFKNLFEKVFINQVKLYVSKVYTNPVKYFVNDNYNEIQKSKLLK